MGGDPSNAENGFEMGRGGGLYPFTDYVLYIFFQTDYHCFDLNCNDNDQHILLPSLKSNLNCQICFINFRVLSPLFQ